jgi:hypothetical protein
MRLGTGPATDAGPSAYLPYLPYQPYQPYLPYPPVATALLAASSLSIAC